MTVRLALVIAVALLVGVTAGLVMHPAAVQPQLHSVWCVPQGLPPDRAGPVITGPGTGLSGCPLGERQVQEP